MGLIRSIEYKKVNVNSHFETEIGTAAGIAWMAGIGIGFETCSGQRPARVLTC